MTASVEFRNVEVDALAPLVDWPAEAIETLVDRGSLSDWGRLARAIEDDPWGHPARMVEEVVGLDAHYGADPLLRRLIDRAREGATIAGRRRYAERIRALRRSCGMSMREFAREVGTSAARISDYENARVAPTTDVLARIEDVATRLASGGSGARR